MNLLNVKNLVGNYLITYVCYYEHKMNSFFISKRLMLDFVKLKIIHLQYNFS
jgi:hypothetical protein